MLPIRTILHPTDFSEHSEAALQMACTLARESCSRLIALHVTPMTNVYGGTVPGSPADAGITRDALEKRLNQIQSPEFTQHVEHQLREGDAATEILRAADELRCDLIVMGSHGRAGLARMIMGSVAEAVLRGARCPVLIVKTPVSSTKATD
jgi:nucleotide-binding universal stress UspA family protein